MWVLDVSCGTISQRLRPGGSGGLRQLSAVGILVHLPGQIFVFIMKPDTSHDQPSMLFRSYLYNVGFACRHTDLFGRLFCKCIYVSPTDFPGNAVVIYLSWNDRRSLEVEVLASVPPRIELPVLSGHVNDYSIMHKYWQATVACVIIYIQQLFPAVDVQSTACIFLEWMERFKWFAICLFQARW